MKELHGHSPKDTGGLEARDKVFNITNYYRNENQSNNEVIPHISQNGRHKKSTNNKCWKGCRENETLLDVGGILVQPLRRTV